MNTRSTKNSIPNNNTSSNTGNPSSNQNGQKRSLHQRTLANMFKKKEAEIVAEPMEILYTVKELLRPTSMDDILENCPKIKSLYEMLSSQPCINASLVFSCLDKYFHGNTTSLWSHKYAPRNLSELFQPDFAEKIQEWIKDFYYFRKEDTPDDSDMDFIDDAPEEYSKSLQLRMVENGWSCRGMVLKGRSGVGKTSFLNAIAKSMRIISFEYASDVDQLQKMKEMGDGSQSQCVNNYQATKKDQINNRIIRSNNSITMFIPSANKKEDLKTKQPRRLQIFRNFSYYFPPFDKTDKDAAEDSYYRYLFQSINKSHIPYVLTTQKREFSFREKSSNQSFGKLDEIQFVENTVEDLTYLYWTIYHIELNLQLKTSHKIRRQELFNELNYQFDGIQLKVVDILPMIRQLVISSNKRPLCIAKYLQFKILFRQRYTGNEHIAIQRCFQDAIDSMGREIFQKIDSDDLINNIDWNILSKPCDDTNPLEQTATEDVEKPEKSQKLEKQYIKKPSLREIAQKLEKQTIEDNRALQKDYYHQFNKKEFQGVTDIPINQHIQAKKQILKNIKNRRCPEKKRLLCQLRQSQMYYLPMQLISRRTTRGLRRHSQQALEETLSKIMNERELTYMQKNSKFVAT